MKPAVLTERWAAVDRTAVVGEQFRKRLPSIIAAKGGHVEHFLISCMTTVDVSTVDMLH